MRVDSEQLTAELSASFSAIVGMQALTAAVSYQQAAAVLRLDNSWVANQLQELSATVAREAPKSLRPQFANSYARLLAKYADQVAGLTGDAPQLTLIDGGKSDDPGDEPSAA